MNSIAMIYSSNFAWFFFQSFFLICAPCDRILFFITCRWVQSANELMDGFAQFIQDRQVINWFFGMELYFCTNIVCSHKIADKLVVTSAVVLFFILVNSVKYLQRLVLSVTVQCSKSDYCEGFFFLKVN